jgi:hypothetical protein
VFLIVSIYSITRQLDFDLVDYVTQLREGILEAYTGVVTGFKNTDKGMPRPSMFLLRSSTSSPVQLLLPHSSNILELIQRCLADDDRSETTVKLCFGLLGDLADCFPNGQLKQLLLSEWIASDLRNKRGMSQETKKTMRWAREVRSVFILKKHHSHNASFHPDDQTRDRIESQRARILNRWMLSDSFPSYLTSASELINFGTPLFLHLESGF